MLAPWLYNGLWACCVQNAAPGGDDKEQLRLGIFALVPDSPLAGGPHLMGC